VSSTNDDQFIAVTGKAKETEMKMKELLCYVNCVKEIFPKEIRKLGKKGLLFNCVVQGMNEP
jgi:hypothetical protein